MFAEKFCSKSKKFKVCCNRLNGGTFIILTGAEKYGCKLNKLAVQYWQ